MRRSSSLVNGLARQRQDQAESSKVVRREGEREGGHTQPSPPQPSGAPSYYGSPAVVADGLLHEVLSRAAKEYGMSVDELKRLPAGKQRRSRHDDITITVVQL